jgi:hypothetical protein
MTRKAKSPGSTQGSKQAEPPLDPALQDRVMERPDGFYWESKQKGESHGPFATRPEAEADMLSGGAAAQDDIEIEGLQEAESELGINEWIDPDTGGPAEDNVPRIEDH